jgi:amino acid permease
MDCAKPAPSLAPDRKYLDNTAIASQPIGWQRLIALLTRNTARSGTERIGMAAAELQLDRRAEIPCPVRFPVHRTLCLQYVSCVKLSSTLEITSQPTMSKNPI